MNERERIESLFEAALELEPERRHDFVAAACGGNESMRAAVLRLLGGHARAGVLDVDPARSIPPEAPVRIGPYRILREIGRGGMGIVYDAERDDGQFRRRVAIKMMRTTDPALLERIDAERHILAALDHPDIARLLDSGTSSGRAWIAMEYVDGLPIDVYCERMRLTVRERLVLFAAVTRAVDFAHRNLVVHRDLKPSNILVTPDGRIKLLDFGIAKLLSPLVGPAASRDRGLTFEYASPEQIAGDSLTTASDVYSLGVVLYELLTGRRPHQQHEHSAADHARCVAEGAVDLPSERVTREENVRLPDGGTRPLTAAVVARSRQTSPRRLARELRGDIDAIVEMALRVEPRGRYGAAELLAQDIDRCLEHRPVRARGGGRMYVLGRLVRRNRAQTALIAGVSAAILAGAGAAVWQASAARHERARAEAALHTSEQVSAFLLGMFDFGEQPLHTVISGRDIVRRGSARIDQLDAQPAVQARLLGALAGAYESLGEYDEGQRSAERALSLTVTDSAHFAKLLVQLGTILRRRGEYDSAQALFSRALDLQERMLPRDDPAIGQTLHHFAGIAVYRGDFAEAERRAREAHALLTARLGETHRATINTLTQLGTIQRARNDRAGAEATLRRAIELRARAPSSSRFEVLNDRFELATLIYGDSTRSAEAEALYRAELPMLRTDAPEDLYFLTWAEGALAALLARRDELDEAEQLRRHVLDVRLRTLGPDHPATAEATLFVGTLAARRGRLDEAESLIRQSAGRYRAAVGDRHPTYASVMVELSDVLLRRGQLAAADSAISTALAIRLERYGPMSHGYTEALRRRAVVQIAQGRHAAAESLLRQALERTLERTGDPQSAAVRSVHSAFADLYAAWGRPADAARHRNLSLLRP